MLSNTWSTVCFFSSDSVIWIVCASASEALLMPRTSDIEFITREMVITKRINILNMDSKLNVLRISMLSFSQPATK